jgi:serine/threonine-protein kinase
MKGEARHGLQHQPVWSWTLTHPNTVQLFDYGQATDGTVFYAMEYLPGMNLQELVSRDGPLPSRRAIHILRQVCSALAEAHAVGFIHRDIKPSNVILCSRGGLHDVVKLLDFGLVRMQEIEPSGVAFTQAGAIFGTPAYMSPEQAAGQKHVDARSDIYSVGALAYFLLTGRPPFVCDSVIETLAAHINDAPVPVRGYRAELSENLEAVVLRCLAKHPAERFADVKNLGQALCACAESEWTQSEAAACWNTISPANSV